MDLIRYKLCVPFSETPDYVTFYLRNRSDITDIDNGAYEFPASINGNASKFSGKPVEVDVAKITYRNENTVGHLSLYPGPELVVIVDKFGLPFLIEDVVRMQISDNGRLCRLNESLYLAPDLAGLMKSYDWNSRRSDLRKAWNNVIEEFGAKYGTKTEKLWKREQAALKEEQKQQEEQQQSGISS